jgi:hypothetical protein
VGGLWAKLNLKDQREIVLLNAPDSFAAELKALRDRRIQTRLSTVKELTFALVFVVKQAEVNKVGPVVASKASSGDVLLWFAYPKGTSTRYSCDFNRDTGWDVLRQCGFDSVRQVAIDEDWSAVRFRRKEFINRRSGT